MTSLLDIGPLTEKVTVRGVDIEVSGLSAMALFELLRDIPELRRLMAEKSIDSEQAASLLTQIPGAVAAIIAAATGHLGEQEHVEAAIRLTAGEQLQFIQPVLRLTFPKGIQSFLDGLFELAPQGATGWGQATRSRAPSSSASATATTSETAGAIPQGS